MTNTLSMPTSDPLLVNSLTGISLSRCLELRLAWLSVRNLFCLLEIHATLIQRSGVVLVAVLFFFICSLFSLLSVSIALARINHRIKFQQLKELPQ